MNIRRAFAVWALEVSMVFLLTVLWGCSDPADEACAVAWSHGYATGLDVGAACYEIAPDVRARCTSTAIDRDACLSCMWDGFDAGFVEGDALCP